MDLDLFKMMLETDSTTGKEREFALKLTGWLKTPGNRVVSREVGDGTLNLLFSWGTPKVYFCTHMDTVPPYIPPLFTTLPDEDVRIDGRGSCDAKGQIFSMFNACKALEDEGYTNFGLLLLAGEETGSFGAQAWDRDCPGGDVVIVGEPTGNLQASAAKGTASYEITIHGKPCHSGYPEGGVSAVERFIDFIQEIRAERFPEDPVLGATTWNVGSLVSANPQNILSPRLDFRLYFRTTFASKKAVEAFMAKGREGFDVVCHGGDEPTEYTVWPGIGSAPVSFGSDAPRLHKFKRRSLLGPGAILDAHTPGEHILLSDITAAIENYKSIAKQILKRT